MNHILTYIANSRKRDLAYDAFSISLLVGMPFIAACTLGVQVI